MRRWISMAAMLATAMDAFAAEGTDLASRSRSLAIGPAVPSPAAEAPFQAGRDPMADLFMAREPQPAQLRAACDTGDRMICYDPGERRLVYRAARRFMPELAGLKAEGVSFRQGRVMLRYSFR